MLTEIRVKNPAGSVLTLPLVGPTKFPIVFVDGLGPAKAEFSSAPYAIIPGEHVQGSRVSPRNIILTLELKPSWLDEGDEVIEDPEYLRAQLYSYFTPGRKIQLEFLTSMRLSESITEGYVESFDPPMFARTPQVQISILCHDPYFKYPTSTVHTPKVVADGADLIIPCPSQVSEGVSLTITPSAAIQGLSFSIGPAFEGSMIVDSYFAGNNSYIFDSRAFRKSVRHSTGLSLLDKIRRGSKWQQLSPGGNSLKITSANPVAGLTYTVQYEFDIRLVGL